MLLCHAIVNHLTMAETCCKRQINAVCSKCCVRSDKIKTIEDQVTQKVDNTNKKQELQLSFTFLSLFGDQSDEAEESNT